MGRHLNVATVPHRALFLLPFGPRGDNERCIRSKTGVNSHVPFIVRIYTPVPSTVTIHTTKSTECVSESRVLGSDGRILGRTSAAVPRRLW